MNIVMITPHMPALNGGANVRNYYLLKNLAKHNSVTLITTDDNLDTINLADYKRDIFSNVRTYRLPEVRLVDRIRYFLTGKIPFIERYKQSTFGEMMRYIPNDTDIIHIAELKTFAIIENYISKMPGIKVLDEHNVDSLRIKAEIDSSNIFRRLSGWSIPGKVKKYELHALRSVDYVLSCSENDIGFFRDQDPKIQYLHIPNGVDTTYFSAKKFTVKRYTVLFVGTMNYPPNYEAVTQYIKKIHPIVLTRFPEYHFRIVGRRLPDDVRTLVSRTINAEYSGFVNDVREAMGEAEVCVCPVRTGSGTRIKILEYMAAERPVVTTTIGCQGLGAEEGSVLLIADEPAKFAGHIIRLLSNRTLVNKIGSAGKKFVSDRYDWSSITGRLEDRYQDFIGNNPKK